MGSSTEAGSQVEKITRERPGVIRREVTEPVPIDGRSMGAAIPERAPPRSRDGIGEPHRRLVELGLKKINLHSSRWRVLFHLNSAVMTRERPKGASSSQGPRRRPGQDIAFSARGRLQAVRVHPRKRMLIAGHTDTSGDPALTRALAAERKTPPPAVRESRALAEVCRKRHRIETISRS